MNTEIKICLQQAIELHMSGEYEEAVACYRAILEQDPIHPVALHYFGIYLFQTGLYEEALANLVVSSELESGNAIWQNDLGNVFFSLEKFIDAESAFLKASQLSPSDHNIWTNLGATYLHLGEKTKAEICFKNAIEIAPEYVPALLHLAEIYQQRDEPFTSAQFQCRAYVLPPYEGKSPQLLATSFYFLGRLREAIDVYQRWLQEEPDNPVAKHMLAACSQEDVPLRASDAYLEKHFDAYAEHFDTNLRDRLKYRGPQCIADGLSQIKLFGKVENALDLGCGTGLCGEVLSQISKCVTGIDISAKMLEQASLTGFYGALIKTEIGKFLGNQINVYDVVVAADTLIYFGRLDLLLLQVARAVRHDGYFIFTTEACSDVLPGYCLHPSGRYQHSHEYVRSCLSKAGLRIEYSDECRLRLEISSVVLGTVYVAKKMIDGHYTVP